MSTREERARLLVEKHAHRIKGLAREPCLSGFLDEFERADREGLNQLVSQLLAEVRRSGTLAGFGLELAVASIAMDVPPERTVRCEQQEGLCKSPGDVWLDHQGRRFEFQCKHSLNWSVELPINDALDRIYDATRNDEPGYLYHLKPSIAGDRKEWLDFADWVIANYRFWDLGGTHRFPLVGSQIAEISLMQERKFPGLISGLQSSPGGVQKLSVDLLKKKLRASLGEAYRSISAPASATQVNCLVVDYDNWMIEKSDIAQALYGHISWFLSEGELKPNPVWDGIFYENPTDFFSAVMFVRATECAPYTAAATVFPNPRWMSDCIGAFSDFPRTKVVSSTSDVDL